MTGVTTQQGIDIGLPGIAGFFEGRSPLIGQGLFLGELISFSLAMISSTTFQYV